jgi:hypothetical protein
MRRFGRFVVALSLAATYACVTAAQETPSGSSSIPKVLQITREFVKPGKAGMVHDKAESAFVDAMARAKWPTHYIGMTSLSGKSRSLYLTSYESFDAWQKDTEAVTKNATLSAALERASVADGELLDSVDQAYLFPRRNEFTPTCGPLPDALHGSCTLPRASGKRKTEVVNMAKAGYEKGVPMRWECSASL